MLYAFFAQAVAMAAAIGAGLALALGERVGAALFGVIAALAGVAVVYRPVWWVAMGVAAVVGLVDAGYAWRGIRRARLAARR